MSSWAALTQGRATIAYPMFAYRPKKNGLSAFTGSGVQEEAGDILADAKAINESRAAEAAQEVIEDTAEEEQPAEQTAQ